MIAQEWPVGNGTAPARGTIIRAKSGHDRVAQNHRLIVGITGASGVRYGVRLLEILRGLPVESHLVLSKAAELTLAYETDLKVAEVKALADVAYPVSDVGAAISSGSFQTLGMVIAPCSVRSMSEIATGVTSNLLTRAADVVLKARRRLVLLLRETPLHTRSEEPTSEIQSLLRTSSAALC